MIRFNDRVSVGETKQTAEGYLVATARVARTGVQHYLADELGDIAFQAGFKSGDVVRVYRHKDQVFADNVMRSITRVPVTVDHPPESVTAENWSKYAVGEVGDTVSQQGEWLVVNPMIKDSAAIAAARDTHKEISMGYQANIVQARDGLDADFEMTDLRMNHLALVPRGRAGSQARIGDSWGASPVQDFKPGSTPTNRKTGGRMSDTTLKTVVIGDSAVQVAATDAALIEQFKKDSAQALVDAESKHSAAIEAKDTEIGELKVQLKAAQDAANIDVDALVAARTALVSQVKALDSSIDPTGKTDAELRKAAVVAKLGDSAVADVSDAEVAGMFKALAAVAPAAKNPVADAMRGGLKVVDDNTQLADAHSAYVARLTRKSKEA